MFERAGDVPGVEASPSKVRRMELAGAVPALSTDTVDWDRYSMFVEGSDQVIQSGRRWLDLLNLRNLAGRIITW